MNSERAILGPFFGQRFLARYWLLFLSGALLISASCNFIGLLMRFMMFEINGGLAGGARALMWDDEPFAFLAGATFLCGSGSFVVAALFYRKLRRNVQVQPAATRNG